MILPDVNLLLYGHDRTSPHHARAVRRGAVIHSADADSGRFRDLLWFNPLADPPGEVRG